MPELPEVETTVRGLQMVLDQAEVSRVVLHRADLRRPFPPDLGQRMTGATITHLSRRAKYGLIHTDRGDALIFHLGMSGRWRINPDAIGKHDHLVLTTRAGSVLALNDPRRFGSVDLWRSENMAAFPAFVKMGPEPLDDGFNAAILHQALKGRAAPVKLLLLDQRIVAGLGNIYVCEALNMARIAPLSSGGSLSRKRLGILVEAIKHVLLQAIEAGGSTLRDYARPDGELGYFAKQWRVYGREGEVCPCGGTVKRFAQGGRSTFYCAKCQR